ncbi:hypothetical protein H7X87_04135 [Acetobacteraceae bacterium]|nr:hypothetical protein [Candidatus Parcubacteria bacterium]
MKKILVCLAGLLGIAVSHASAEPPPVSFLEVDLVNNFQMINCDSSLQIDTIVAAWGASSILGTLVTNFFTSTPSALAINGESYRISACAGDEILYRVRVVASERLLDQRRNGKAIKLWKLTVREYQYQGLNALHAEYSLRTGRPIYDTKGRPLFLETTVLWTEPICDTVDLVCSTITIGYSYLGERL